MHEIPELDDRGLRNFALVTAVLVVGLFGIALPLVFELAWPLWPWLLAALLVLPGLVAPRLLNPVYKMWMRFGLAMNRIVTPVIMGAVFYLMFFPVGLLMRVFGRDPMQRKADPARESYRQVCDPGHVNNMEKPY